MADPPAEPMAVEGFADREAAVRLLRRLAEEARERPGLEACLPGLLKSLAGTANPDRALLNLERLARLPISFDLLARDPHLADMLVTLFAGSQFFSEVLLRNPGYLVRLADRRRLALPKAPEELASEASAAMEGCPSEEARLDALRSYQKRELLRVGACDLLGLLDLPTVTAQLSHLADCLVRISLDLAARQQGATGSELAVIALGKLGGQELNYSSDIDLLFIAGRNPSACTRLAEQTVAALTRVTAEGFLYRVDLRLRPWGHDGPLVTSLEGHLRYLQEHARLWEKQALLKARSIAGDATVGEAFLLRAGPLLFASPGEAVRADVHAMKQRIEQRLREGGREWGEVKLGRGSIRDVEFVAQYLQLLHGARHPEVLSRNTLDALARLHRGGFLTADDYRTLADGYTFLRPVEHYLQIMQYRQTHTLPDDPLELARIARRLGFRPAGAGARFLGRYQEHAAAIRAVYQRYLEEGEVITPAEPGATLPSPDVPQHVARMAPSYAETFDRATIAHHAELAERLDASNLVEVDATPLDGGRWRVTVVAYDYPGELSLICGLLFAHGFSIRDGHVFTYEPAAAASPSKVPTTSPVWPRRESQRRKIVDVFHVRSVLGEMPGDVWAQYAAELGGLLRRLEAGEQRQARGELARRVAVAVRELAGPPSALYPIDIQIDNEASDRYTVLDIDAPDTIGFLYEFTNALALRGVYIARVTVDSAGSRVRDTFYLTDARGRKITSPAQERELRAATVLVKHFTHLLTQSPNPESALLHFGEFLGQLFARPDWPAELSSLERPEVLNALARLLGVSDFLWDDFLRMQHESLYPVVRDVDALARAKPKAEQQEELAALLQAAPDGAVRRAALNVWKDREMFRVDMRHIQDPGADLDRFSAELTDLAEVVVEGALRLCAGELRAQFGAPRQSHGQEVQLSVCALGKCGGRELGFASDIELMLLFTGPGQTDGPRVISAAEYYEELVRQVSQAILARRQGIFEVDLQLRPYGRAGSLAVSLESFRRYFAPGGPAWPYERQALVKLRPIAGDPGFGGQIVALRDEFVYSGEPFDVGAMRAMRERQIRHHVTGGTLNAKYSLGGRVDIEYLVQALQIQHGHVDPRLRLTNTGEAMAALAAAGILSPDDHARLREAYAFLRQLTDALRMVRGNAKDLTVPPAGSDEFAFLARRLRYNGDLACLQADLARHTTCVQELNRRLLG